MVIFGAFFEGETFLLPAGFAAHQGCLKFYWVMFAAFIGTLAGDQFFFLLGRLRSRAIIERRPRWKKRIERARRLLDNHRLPVIFGLRFCTDSEPSFPLPSAEAASRFRAFFFST